jgi:hypothetical protein
MPFPRGVIDNENLNLMQQATASACRRLELKENDVAGRERVAFLVTGFTRAGEFDIERLVGYVVDQFKRPCADS